MAQEPTAVYDLIVHDTFTGGSTPEHLMSLEVVRTTSGHSPRQVVSSRSIFAGYISVA